MEKDVSSVDAIDDLTSRLSISSLAMRVEASYSSSDTSGAANDSQATATKINSSGGGDNGDACSTVTSSSSSPSQKNTPTQRTSKCVRSAVGKNVSAKPVGRKRPLLGCEEPVVSATMAGKERKEMIEVELSKKAKLAEEVKKIPDASVRCKSPTGALVRSKRGAVHREQDQQLLTQQPAMKRPRANSGL